MLLITCKLSGINSTALPKDNTTYDLTIPLPYLVCSFELPFTFQKLYDEMVPAFDVLGKKSFFLGEIGNGAKMKLVVNMIMGR